MKYTLVGKVFYPYKDFSKIKNKFDDKIIKDVKIYFDIM